MLQRAAALAVAGVMLVSLSACGGSKPEQSASPSKSPAVSSEKPSASASTEQTAFLGRVKSIDGNTIELEVVKEGASGAVAPASSEPQAAPSAGKASAPAQSPSAPAPAGSTAAGKQAASPSAPPAAGTSGAGGKSGTSSYQATGEKKKITADSSTTVTVLKGGVKSAGKVSDISVGDIVRVTMSGDKVKAIEVVEPAGGAQPSTASPGAAPEGPGKSAAGAE